MDAPSRPFEAVIFDFDGTLAEPVLDFGAMKRMVAEEAAPHLPMVPPANGLPALEYAASLARDMADPATAGRFLDSVARRIREMEIEAAGRARLFPHTRQALATLAHQGSRCGIITRNCRAAVDRVFPDAATYADVILTRDEARHVKPDPRHLLDALATLDAAPDRSLMVGDHPMDVATGKAAGTFTAGVACGHASREDLAKAGADWLAGNVGELVAVLQATGGKPF